MGEFLYYIEIILAITFIVVGFYLAIKQLIKWRREKKNIPPIAYILLFTILSLPQFYMLKQMLLLSLQL